MGMKVQVNSIEFVGSKNDVESDESESPSYPKRTHQLINQVHTTTCQSKNLNLVRLKTTRLKIAL